MKVRARVLASGIVQGVFFRSFTRTKARMKGVSGWVRNLPDGRVEAVLEGDRDSVEDVIGMIRQGPDGSKVDDVHVSWEKPSHKYREFVIKA